MLILFICHIQHFLWIFIESDLFSKEIRLFFFFLKNQPYGTQYSRPINILFSLQCQPPNWTPLPSLTWVSVWASMTWWPGSRSVNWSPLESKWTIFIYMNAWNFWLKCFYSDISICIFISNMFVICCTSILYKYVAIKSVCDLYKLCVVYCSYIPAVVDHTGGLPCHGTYLLHQVFILSIYALTNRSVNICF